MKALQLSRGYRQWIKAHVMWYNNHTRRSPSLCVQQMRNTYADYLYKCKLCIYKCNSVYNCIWKLDTCPHRKIDRNYRYRQMCAPIWGLYSPWSYYAFVVRIFCINLSFGASHKKTAIGSYSIVVVVPSSSIAISFSKGGERTWA